MKNYRVLFLSDLHAFSSAEVEINTSKPSYIDISQPNSDALKNPLTGLSSLLKDNIISPMPDTILCGGDIADKAAPASLTSTWKELCDLAKTCKCIAPSLLDTL